MKKLICILLVMIPLLVKSQQMTNHYFPGNFAWKYVGNPDFSSGTVSGISLAVSQSPEEPYIAYTNDDFEVDN